jgi:(p)ppGpp synthase/HD superfamily hydrolase
MKKIILEEMTEDSHREFEERQNHPTTKDVFTKAKYFATIAHGDQMRKGEKDSYIIHPTRVVKMLQSIGVKDQEVLAAAWLHDVLEDTNEKIDDFSPRIQKIVGELTKSGDKNSYLQDFSNKSKDAILIKLADRYDNLKEGKQTMGESWLKKYLISTKILLDAAEKSGIKKWNIGSKMYEKLRNLYNLFSVSSAKKI